MNVAIMQPYFFPYLGYFQLINHVDIFIIYDNIQYTKKGWINRNRLLLNGKDILFSLPIKKDSDYLDIYQRQLSSNYMDTNKKTLRIISLAYKKSKMFNTVYPLFEKCFLYEESSNLFEFILFSIKQILEYLQIKTDIKVSSSMKDCNPKLKKQDRVLDICKKQKANIYTNPIGGIELYNKEEFLKNNIELNFLKMNEIEYNQQAKNFIPSLSIIDVLMNNDLDEITQLFNEYEII